MRNRILCFFLLVLTLVAFPVLALPTVTAVRCDGCTYAQAEQKAIGLGLGEHYLYDFTGGELSRFQVSREPAPGGRYLYEAVPLSVDAEYVSYFNKVLDYRRQFGPTKLVVTVNLPEGSGPYASMNVYDIYKQEASAGAFGNWLARAIVSDAADNLRAKTLVEMSRSNGQVTLQEDPVEMKVFVNFRNGRAEFKMSANGQFCELVPGTVYDSDGRRIPGDRSQVSDLPYEFAGGTASSNYQDFLAQIRRLGIPVGTSSGMWACVSVAGVGERCQLVR